MIVALVIAGVTAAGFLPATAIDRQQPLAARIGLGFLYGSALVYAALLLLSLIGVAWSMWIAVLVMGALSLPFIRRVERASASMRWSLMDIATGLAAILYARVALSVTPFHWDFWAIWGLKGAVFFESRGIDWQLFRAGPNAVAHPDYPLLLPLNYAFTALAQGQWNDRWLGAYSVAYGVALLLVIRAVLSRELPVLAASVVTFAAAGIALTPWIGYAEAPLIAYATAGLVMLRRGILFGDDGALRHAVVLLGFAAVTKNEGVALFAIALVAILLHRVPLRRLTMLWAPALMIGSWVVLRFAYGLQSDLAAAGAAARVLSRLESFGSIAALMMTWLHRPLLWSLMLIGALIVMPRLWIRERLVLGIVAAQFLLFLLVYLGTPHDVEWHIGTSWARLSGQLGAPLIVVIMISLAQWFRGPEEDRRAAA